MPVSGVIVMCELGETDSVRRRIESHPRLEVRDASDAGLIVVTDSESSEQDREDVEWLASVEGVVATHPAFTSVEDIAVPDSASPKQRKPEGTNHE